MEKSECYCGKSYINRKGGYEKHCNGPYHQKFIYVEDQRLEQWMREEEQRLDDEAYDNYILGLEFDTDRVERIVYG